MILHYSMILPFLPVLYEYCNINTILLKVNNFPSIRIKNIYLNITQRNIKNYLFLFFRFQICVYNNVHRHLVALPDLF